MRAACGESIILDDDDGAVEESLSFGWLFGADQALEQCWVGVVWVTLASSEVK